MLAAPWLVLVAAAAEPATLYERIASGPLVIRGRCFAVGGRAAIEVVEVLRGKYTEQMLQVAYRLDNINRLPGSAKIEFSPGGESILVLEPEKDARERIKAPDRFVLVEGAKGKIDLPAEGGPALLQAAHRFTEIQALKDQMEVWTAQRDLIREVNPLMVGAGFEEILKFRLGDESLVLPLVTHLEGPRPEFRKFALRVIGQMFEKQRRTGREIVSGDLLVQETLARATGDESPEIRAEAVRSLRELQRPSLVDTLARVAANDPSQMVRYEAEIALSELRQPPPSPR